MTCRTLSFPVRGDHTESIQLQFDPSKISYNELLDMFWNNHDCTSARSKQYMSAIFYHSEEQQEKALASRDIFQTTQSRKIVTRIDEAQTFYNAEEYDYSILIKIMVHACLCLWFYLLFLVYFSYHQKYILRQNPSVLAELNLSDAELITSHVAARLNGYLGGHGTQKQLQEELDEFSLSNKVKEKIRAKVGAKQSGL